MVINGGATLERSTSLLRYASAFSLVTNVDDIGCCFQRKRAKRKQYARQEQQGESTTREKLRQSRSNPHANVRLSGKKKRQLLKEARRMVTEQLVVDGKTKHCV